jgi:hypothetical protein
VDAELVGLLRAPTVGATSLELKEPVMKKLVVLALVAVGLGAAFKVVRSR